MVTGAAAQRTTQRREDGEAATQSLEPNQYRRRAFFANNKFSV
jgi:hypothetical protein